MSNKSEYLTPGDVAEALKLDIDTIQALARRGEIPAVKIPVGRTGRIRIPRAEFENWLTAHRMGR